MNIFVLVKQVPDTETKISPNGDASFINTDSIKWTISPYDEFAIEQALLVKEKNSGSTVTVVRVGAIHDSEALRNAMAMGADDSILVEAPDLLDPWSTAKALKGAIEKSGKNPDLIFAGKQAIDSDGLQVPQLLAEQMNLPSVSVVVKYEGEGENFVVHREIEGGNLEVYNLKTPAVLSCNKGLNSPRYAPLPGIIKAKKKPLLKLSLGDVGVSDSDCKLKYSNFRLPPEKPPGKSFDATDEGNISSVTKEVLNLLRSEAKVL